MAKSVFGCMPVDQPVELAPGLSFREADFFGQEAPLRGFGAGLTGDTLIGAAKGNRSLASLPPRRALTGPGPFGPMKGGR